MWKGTCIAYIPSPSLQYKCHFGPSLVTLLDNCVFEWPTTVQNLNITCFSISNLTPTKHQYYTTLICAKNLGYCMHILLAMQQLSVLIHLLFLFFSLVTTSMDKPLIAGSPVPGNLWTVNDLNAVFRDVLSFLPPDIGQYST